MQYAVELYCFYFLLLCYVLWGTDPAQDLVQVMHISKIRAHSLGPSSSFCVFQKESQREQLSASGFVKQGVSHEHMLLLAMLFFNILLTKYFGVLMRKEETQTGYNWVGLSMAT